jgi:hypothetical protein
MEMLAAMRCFQPSFVTFLIYLFCCCLSLNSPSFLVHFILFSPARSQIIKLRFTLNFPPTKQGVKLKKVPDKYELFLRSTSSYIPGQEPAVQQQQRRPFDRASTEPPRMEAVDHLEEGLERMSDSEGEMNSVMFDLQHGTSPM